MVTGQSPCLYVDRPSCTQMACWQARKDSKQNTDKQTSAATMKMLLSDANVYYSDFIQHETFNTERPKFDFQRT